MMYWAIGIDWFQDPMYMYRQDKRTRARIEALYRIRNGAT